MPSSSSHPLYYYSFNHSCLWSKSRASHYSFNDSNHRLRHPVNAQPKQMIKLILITLSLPLLPSTNQKWYTASGALFLLTLISILILYAPHTRPQAIYHPLSIDTLRAPLITLTLWISALIILARQKVKINKKAPNLIISTILLLNSSLIIAFRANQFFLFYIFFEASLVPTLILILLWGYQPERLQAGTYLILYTVSASLPLLLNLLIINSFTGHIRTLLPLWHFPQFLGHFSLSAWWLTCIAAFLVKLPLYTTHLWLPKAHVEAPVAGSIILAGVLLKLGSYGLLRISEKLPLYLNTSIAFWLATLAAWGAVATSFICLRQPDLKSLIAYSSVGHIGLLLAGLLSNSTWGWHGALGIRVAHGLCSSGLFALANITYESTNTRRLFLTKGMQIIFPTMTIWWFLFSAANIAAPPSINLLSEIILLTRITAISFSLIPLLILISFIAAAYSLTLFTSTQHGCLPQSINPSTKQPASNHLILLAHLSPIGLFILKPELITIWT